MFKTIEDIMYMTDGNNPFRDGLLYGKGGLGYKPTPYNMVGGMIGGMAYRDIKNPNKILYENFNEDDDKFEDLEIPELINLKDDINDEEFKRRLINEAEELVELYKDAIYENNTTLKDNVINDYKVITKQLNTLNLTDEERDRLLDYKNEIKETKKKTNKEIIKENINNENSNVFYDKMNVLADDMSNDISNKYLNGNKKEKDDIVKKYINGYFDEQKFSNLQSENEKADFIKNKVKIYEKGNKSEEKLIDKDILLTFLDKDESDIFDTKDINAYNPKFINDLNDIGLKGDALKEQVLDKMNIDAVKGNTIWELKAFGKNSYDPKYNREDYSKAKFRGSEPFKIQINKPNGKYDLWTMKYTINKNPDDDKILNINYKIESNFPSWDNRTPKKFIGNILKDNTNGYNYYILENNRDKIQYINPLQQDNWDNIIKHFKDNPSIKKVNIPNLKFIKYPKEYIDRYENIRLKKNIRTDKKNMYKEWIKSKSK